jgi:hypothetical protein
MLAPSIGALKELETAAKLDPTDRKIRFSLARVYHRLGRQADRRKFESGLETIWAWLIFYQYTPPSLQCAG